MQRKLLTTAMLAILLYAACGGGSAGSGGESGGPVSLGLAVKNDISNAPLVLGDVQGVYDDYGLRVELVYFDGGGPMVQAMAGGQVDYGWVSHTPIVKAASQGAPVKVIAEVSQTAIGWGLMVVPDSPIQTPEDIESGMKISYTSDGALTNWLALYEAKQAGLEPSEIQGVPIGTSLPTITKALASGQIDAATVLVPWGYILEKEGDARWVAKMPEQLPNFSYTGIDATEAALEDEQTASCMVGAYTATVKWMRDNPEETQKWFQDFYDVDAELAKKSYNELTPDFNPTGKLESERFQETIDTISEVPGFLTGSPQASDVLEQVEPASKSECGA
jgi:NitT/TauT family transport system substrate-binding protein